MDGSGGRFRWTGARERAARRVARGFLAGAAIAAEAGVRHRAFREWKRHAAFRARVAAHVRAFRRRVVALALSRFGPEGAWGVSGEVLWDDDTPAAPERGGERETGELGPGHDPWWTTRRELAALLVALDLEPDREIAAAVRTTPITLARWKRKSAFRERVAEHVAAFQEEAERSAFTAWERRVKKHCERA